VLAAAIRGADEHLRSDAIAAMVYGSSARGDSNLDSDIDILQLVPTAPGTDLHGRISIVSYLPVQLQAMSAGRSLFAWHLRTEGVYIFDTDGALHRILESHPGPDGAMTTDRLRALSPVLDVSEPEFDRHSAGLRRVCRFLLRTAVYATAIDAGAATFSTEHASAHIDPTGKTYSVLENLKAERPNSWVDFDEARMYLKQLIGSLSENPYQSLEALAVRTEETNRGLSSLALHIISDAAGELDYANVRMPIL
jgi:predicted nucleotidyltransferase